MTCEAIKTYSLALNDRAEIIGEVGDPKISGNAGAELDLLAQAYALEHDCSYPDAFARVKSDPSNASLVKAYSGIGDALGKLDIAGEVRRRIPNSGAPGASAGKDIGHQVDAATRAHMRETGEKDYSTALTSVWNADDDLKQRYVRS